MSGLPKTEIDAWIGKAEERWLHPLLGHVESCFQPTFLPSHDHTHHLRVWKTGSRLLREIAWIREDLDPGLVEGLLIASLFHDAGMHRSTGPDHGKWSRELCAEYFRNEPQPHPARWEEILDAIERHDLKTPEVYPELSSSAPPGILGLLSLADDLEAFGIIGIYRYIEIYLARRTPLAELGIRVLANASARYSHLRRAFGDTSLSAGNYREKYNELVDFFDGYNQQWVAGWGHTRLVHWGHQGVVRAIVELVLEKRIHPEQLHPVSDRNTTFVSGFFKRLHDEMETESNS